MVVAPREGVTGESGPVDPTAPFAAVDTAAVSQSVDLSPETLTAALARVQESVRGLPSVPDVVYEYRRAFRTDPLVAHHGDAYYLRVPSRVWPEFADAAELSATELDACRTVHEAAFHAVVTEHDALARSHRGEASSSSDGETPLADDREPLVLVARGGE